MYRRAETIFYASAIAILMAVFFIARPAPLKEVSSLQDRIVSDTSLAFAQLVGDEPLFEGVAYLWDGVNSFYSQAADYTLALLTPTESETQLAGKARNAAVAFVQTRFVKSEAGEPGIDSDLPMQLAAAVLPEEALSNEAAFDDSQAKPMAEELKAKVAGIAITKQNREFATSWVTIEDAVTKQKYCLAIYNGEVNKYLGECHAEQYY